MRKIVWTLLGLLALSGGLRAEVVLAPGTFSSSVNQNTTDLSQGFTFTTTGSSAASGRWRLTDLQFGLAASTGGQAITNYNVWLYKANGSNWQYVTGGTKSVTATTGINLSANTLFNMTFDQNAAFGIDGDLSSGLDANTTYMLGINAVTANPSDQANIYFSGSSALPPLSGWGRAQSVTNTTGNAFASATLTSSDIANWTSPNSMYVQLQATAVPEPGTLILGGFAAAAGGAGAWWRRRKNRKAAAEQNA